MSRSPERSRDDGSPLSRWAEPEVLVVCPRCARRAAVRPHHGDAGGRRLVCPACGLAKHSDALTSTWGVPVDPWFGEPLWLRAQLAEHTVWAYNAAHLHRLRSHVAAGQRERRTARGAPMSMAEKLPAWLTSAKNRDAVVAVLDRLATRL